MVSGLDVGEPRPEAGQSKPWVISGLIPVVNYLKGRGVSKYVYIYTRSLLRIPEYSPLSSPSSGLVSSSSFCVIQPKVPSQYGVP